MCTHICHSVKQFIVEEDGPTALEYAVMICGIILVCMTAIGLFGSAISNWFTGATPTIGALQTSP